MAYSPNKALHPGRIIAEVLEREGMSQKNLGERTGISEKHLSQIINGEASITVETSLMLENALGGSASFWINLEKNYQETKARLERHTLLKEESGMLSKFPYAELAKRGFVESTMNKEKRVENLWRFFGVNSLSYVATTEPVAFRRKSTACVKIEAIASWLRCGELEAKKIDLPEYSESKVKETLGQLKILSTKEPEEYSKDVVELLRKVGVALVFIEHFPGAGVSGAFRWISDKPVIQLSLFYPWADVFWFNLYHELGHLVLHGKKDKFIEFDEREYAPEKDKEDEADKFASDSLISHKLYTSFIEKGDVSQAAVNAFAAQLEVHPGIVAGRLCHDDYVDWKSVSKIRPRLQM